MTISTALNATYKPDARGGMTIGWLLILGFLATLSLTQSNPRVSMVPVASVALIASLAGHLSVELFCFGIAVTFGPTENSGIPYGALIPMAIALGTVLRAILHKRPLGGTVGLPLLVIVLGTYWFITPPSTSAGIVSAYAFFVMPASILVLNWAVTQAADQGLAVPWFAAGVFVSIGAGLVQAYQEVGRNYHLYQSVRTFESSIGSSNYAAALAAVTGVLLVSLALERGSKRSILVVAAAPFLAAPFIFASRGALIAIASGAIALAIRSQPGRQRSRFIRIVILTAGVVGLAMVAADRGWFIWERLTSQNSSSGYLSGRIDLWGATLKIIAGHPLIGIGPGHLADSLLTTLGSAYSHNTYLETLAQLGVVGGLVCMYLVRPQPFWRWSPVVPALVVVTVNSAVEPVISTPIGAVLYAGLVASHLAATGRPTQRTIQPELPRKAERL